MCFCTAFLVLRASVGLPATACVLGDGVGSSPIPSPGGEARGWVKGLQEQRHGEAEIVARTISEAVLRREQARHNTIEEGVSLSSWFKCLDFIYSIHSHGISSSPSEVPMAFCITSAKFQVHSEYGNRKD